MTRATTSLATLDQALLRLRRFTEAPAGNLSAGPRENIDMSTVLVVDAVEQLIASGQHATVGGIGDRLSVAPSTASRLIDRASAAGMVARHRSAADSRQVIIHLTEPGHALAARARDYRRARLAEVLSAWPADRVERFAQDVNDFALLALTHQEGARP